MRLFRPSVFASLLFRDAIFRIKTSEKILFLTFDDGPDPESTPQILEILDDMNIRTLFFCNGRASEKYPELTRQIRQRGHRVGNHGYVHLDGWKTTAEKYCSNVTRASEFTSDDLFRPPYGKLGLFQYRCLREMFRIVFWDLMVYDFDNNFGAERSLSMLKRKIRPGSIIVLHDKSGSTCRQFLKEFIGDCLDRGYRFELPDW